VVFSPCFIWTVPVCIQMFSVLIVIDVDVIFRLRY